MYNVLNKDQIEPFHMHLSKPDFTYQYILFYFM